MARHRFDPKTQSRAAANELNSRPISAQLDQAARIRALKKGGIAARHLADSLEGCRKGMRCHSIVCTGCAYRTQQMLIKAMLEQLPLYRGGSNAKMLTIITGLRVALGGLASLSPARLANNLRKALSRAGCKGAVFGLLELDLITTTKSSESYWMPHWHLMAIGPTAAQLERLRKSVRRSAKGIARPFNSKSIQNPIRQAAYIAKFRYQRRVSYIDKKQRWNTRKLPLRQPEARELLLWLDRHRPLQLLFCSGLKFKKGHFVRNSVIDFDDG